MAQDSNNMNVTINDRTTSSWERLACQFCDFLDQHMDLACSNEKLRRLVGSAKVTSTDEISDVAVRSGKYYVVWPQINKTNKVGTSERICGGRLPSIWG